MQNFTKALCLLAALVLGQPAIAVEIIGGWQQGEMMIGKVTPGATVTLGERELRVSPSGEFVFGLGRDASAPVTLSVVQADGAAESHTFTVKKRQYKEQRVDGVPPETVNPPEAELARIEKENALTRAARRHDLPRTEFLQRFQWPVLGPVTGVYGSRRIYNGEPRNAHFGLDVAASNGTPINAPAGGKVTLVYPDMFFSGGTLIVDHGHGISSTFIHLSEILVNEGDEITQGQPIAKVGATGRATGPHLHWALNWFGERLDPQLLLSPIPGQSQ